MATLLTASRSPLSMSTLRSPLAVLPQTWSKPEYRGLSHWMNRVLEELGRLRAAPDPDTVHDLRVAIRRCRSLAGVMEEVDPDPTWPEMRKVARRLFRGLGALRDAQVMKGWVKNLGQENDLLRLHLFAGLETDEKRLSESALMANRRLLSTRCWLPTVKSVCWNCGRRQDVRTSCASICSSRGTRSSETCFMMDPAAIGCTCMHIAWN